MTRQVVSDFLKKFQERLDVYLKCILQEYWYTWWDLKHIASKILTNFCYMPWCFYNIYLSIPKSSIWSYRCSKLIIFIDMVKILSASNSISINMYFSLKFRKAWQIPHSFIPMFMLYHLPKQRVIYLKLLGKKLIVQIVEFSLFRDCVFFF